MTVAFTRTPLARAAVFFLLLIAAIALNATRATASPNAANIAILESQCEPDAPATTLRNQLLAEPGIASVAFINGDTTVPTAASLASYEGVVAMGDCAWMDRAATGDALADYEDAGGVVIGTNYDWEGTSDYTLAGRWISGGYAPFQPDADAIFNSYTLGAHDATNPIMAGVTSLSGGHDNNVSPAPGATTVATWSDGLLGIAVKGHAVGINEYLGDQTRLWDGQFGRVIANAVKLLERQQIAVNKTGAGKGTVTSSVGGVSCGSTCATSLLAPGATVAFTAIPAAGSAFTGWAGSCTGIASCSLQAAYGQSVTASFAISKLKYGTYRSGKLRVTLPGAGKLGVKASGIKAITKTVTKGGTLNLAINPTKKLKKKLAKGKSVNVKFKFAFTPAGAAKATSSSKTIKLKS